jgi:hypothetical protein
VTSSTPESASQAASAKSQASEPTDDSRNRLLEYAWERHDTYSDNASNAQKRFFFIRRLLAYLSVTVVVLSVVQPILENRITTGFGFDDDTISNLSLLALFGQAFRGFELFDPTTWGPNFYWLGGLALVDFLLIFLPIFATGLLAFAVKFDRGNNWVLLRGNSESLKMEIFYYRTRVRQYKRNRNAVLAEKIQLISERVKGSAVHQAALSPYEGQAKTRVKKGVLIIAIEQFINLTRQGILAVWDFLMQFREVEDKTKPSAQTSDRVPNETQVPEKKRKFLKRYADLKADDYIQYRLEDQFDWYRRKAKIYDRDYQILQTYVYFFGGVGTLLAAIGFQNWVAVSTALATSLAGYLEYKRVEATLVGYNQAADALYDIRAWWYSLSADDQEKPVNFEKLVASTEETIRSEHTSWLQDMQDRLANLYGDVGDEEEQEGETEEQEAPKPEAGGLTSSEEGPTMAVASPDTAGASALPETSPKEHPPAEPKQHAPGESDTLRE